MTDSEYEHRCHTMVSEGVSVARAEHFLGDGDWAWCLVVTRCATEEDLQDFQYLEQVGDAIWQTMVGISHCPFCGMRLGKTDTGKSPAEADFHHIDSSRSWYSKRL